MINQIRGSKIGHIRERRHLVSEISARDYGSSGRTEWDSQAHGNTHESHSQSAYGSPGGSRGQRGERAYKAGCDQEILRRYEFQAVVDDHGNSSAGDPGADQNPDTEHDQDRRHRFMDTVDDALFHFFPFETEDEAEGARDKSGCHKEDLGSDFVDSVTDSEKEPHGN